MKTIPSDELTALHTAHVMHGRRAKSLIRDLWREGAHHSTLHSSVDRSALQRFRNSEHGGPSGLNRLSLSKLAREAGI